jgi:hypothetical protein
LWGSALAASSWYEGRKDVRDEQLVLQQLHQTLEQDLANLTTVAAWFRQIERDITALLDHLESHDPYTDNVGQYLQSVRRIRSLSIRSAPFEALKAQGLDVISNESLRLKLISLYEDLFQKLMNSNEVNRTFSQEMVTPYLMMNFRKLESLSWVPYDYEKIRSDGYLANLSRTRLNSFRLFVLPNFEATIEAIREILDEIESELDG